VINDRPLLVSRGWLRCSRWRGRFLMMNTSQRQIFTLAAGLRNFFTRRCAEALSFHRKLLRELAIAEHLHAFKKFVRQTGLCECLGRDRRTVIESIELLDINDRVNGPKFALLKPRFGIRRIKGI